MKKLLLVAIATTSFTYCFAQSASIKASTKIPVNKINSETHTNGACARTTAAYDTLSNITSIDSVTLYKAGSDTSGYVTGTDIYGDMGFAERYDFNDSDSTLQVIGIVAMFGGTYSDSAVDSVIFRVWDMGSQGTFDPFYSSYYYNGLPNIVLDSITVPVNQLGINLGNASLDTPKAWFFSTPTNYLDSSFYAGYNIYYSPGSLNGDTIGLYCTLEGERESPLYSIVGTAYSTIDSDTLIINVQNATQNAGGNWIDNYFDNIYFDSVGFANDLYIFPIVVFQKVSSVKGVTKNNFTLYGNYPNPAVAATNIHFSLAAETDVTVQIEDLNGHLVNTIKQNNLCTGEHTIPVETSGMAAGDYLYIIRTSGGDGIASKMSIIK